MHGGRIGQIVDLAHEYLLRFAPNAASVGSIVKSIACCSAVARDRAASDGTRRDAAGGATTTHFAVMKHRTHGDRHPGIPPNASRGRESPEECNRREHGTMTKSTRPVRATVLHKTSRYSRPIIQLARIEPTALQLASSTSSWGGTAIGKRVYAPWGSQHFRVLQESVRPAKHHFGRLGEARASRIQRM